MLFRSKLVFNIYNRLIVLRMHRHATSLNQKKHAIHPVGTGVFDCGVLGAAMGIEGVDGVRECA